MKVDNEYLYTKSCPHCDEHLQITVKKYGTTMYYVRCDKCLSRGPLRGNAVAAIEAWNERSADTRKDSANVSSMSIRENGDTPF